jgi:hydrophobic/amphiphilic exporter-1 (mainly G- bacteria), HAE1 family
MLKGIFANRTAALLTTAILCLVGIVLVTQLPVQLYPQTQRPRVRLRIDHVGYSSVDFQRRFGDDIEAKLLAVEGIDLLQAAYSNDHSEFTLTFKWEVDSDRAKADTQASATAINATLPADIQDEYTVRFFSGENAGYLMIGVTSASASPEELYAILKTTVEPELDRIKDAEVVEIFNVEDLRAEINLRQDDMLAYGLTIADVDNTMRAGYLPEPLGNLREGDRRYSVRYSRGVKSVYDLGRMVVADREGVIVTLDDIADVTVKYDLPNETFVMDGARGLRITATPVDGGNIRKMSEDVRAVLARARSEGVLPSDTRVVPYLDPADYINRSIKNIIDSGLLGGALAMIIVLMTLGEVRNTLLIALSIPTSTVLSFILMSTFHITLNLISLGGLALAVGMVVDASVVVMENIHRHRTDEAPIRDNKQLRDVIIRATNQVFWAVIGSTVTTIIVFFPISLTAPLTNAILGDQARTVIFTLTFSMFVALWIVPLLAFLVYGVRKGRGGDVRPAAADGEAQVRGLQRLTIPVMRAAITVYKGTLRALLARRWASVTLVVACFGLLAWTILRVLPLIPKEIIAPPSSDRVVVFFRSTVSIESEDVLRDVVPGMQALIAARLGPTIETTYAEVRGTANRFFIDLKDERQADWAVAELQKLFVSDNRWYYNVMKWDPAQLPLPRTMDLQISVHGEDPAELVTLLERTRDLVNGTELYGFTYSEPNTNLADQFVITPRRETIQGFTGMSETGLTGLVRRVLRGTATVEFDQGASKIEVAAVYPDITIDSRDKLVDFLVPYKQSAVPLKHFFDFTPTTGVAGLASENGERIFRLYAKMRPTEPAASRAVYESRIRDLLKEKLPLRPGYTVVFENPQVELDEAIRSLYVSLAAAIVVVYLYLVFQFKSLKIPVVILVTVPLGVIGVILSLYVFKSSLCLNSLLGTILLAGTAVNNAIVMIDFYLQVLPSAPSRLDAVVETAGLRFTPIMITSLTATIGMLPIALGMGEGANIVQPLGIAVSGGLMVSTMFTLFVVPAIMSLVNLAPRED